MDKSTDSEADKRRDALAKRVLKMPPAPKAVKLPKKQAAAKR